MKFASSVLALGFAAVSSVSFAQTCASPTAFNTPPAGPVASGTTCGGTDSVSLYCGALDSASKPDAIYQMTLAAVGPNRTATQIALSGVTGAGFGPIIVAYNSTCANGDGCASTGDGSSALSLAAVGAGTYFLAVSASPVDASGACGTFTLTANGTLPVQLQNFSID
jgi:hypothetical protein